MVRFRTTVQELMVQEVTCSQWITVHSVAIEYKLRHKHVGLYHTNSKFQYSVERGENLWYTVTVRKV